MLSAAALHIRKLSVLIRPVCAASVLSLRAKAWESGFDTLIMSIYVQLGILKILLRLKVRDVLMVLLVN